VRVSGAKRVPPLMLIITGTPASGKTTIGRELASASADGVVRRIREVA